MLHLGHTTLGVLPLDNHGAQRPDLRQPAVNLHGDTEYPDDVFWRNEEIGEKDCLGYLFWNNSLKRLSITQLVAPQRDRAAG